MATSHPNLKRALVAGGTGYLGGFVAREFASRGFFVRALVRSSKKKVEALRDVTDEIVLGEITRPETLDHICDGIDAVFSSVGITRQKDGLTFRDVDYRGNTNLLNEALRAGVERSPSTFRRSTVQISRHLNMVNTHEAFVDELKASGIDYAVLRPTGYFSDMGEILNMARKGRVYLIGDGNRKVNPIHGADLALSLCERSRGQRNGDRCGWTADPDLERGSPRSRSRCSTARPRSRTFPSGSCGRWCGWSAFSTGIRASCWPSSPQCQPATCWRPPRELAPSRLTSVSSTNWSRSCRRKRGRPMLMIKGIARTLFDRFLGSGRP